MTTPFPADRPGVPRRRWGAAVVALLLGAVAAACSTTTDGAAGPEAEGSGGAPAGSGAPGVDEGSGVAPVPELPVTVASADDRSVTVADVSRIVPLRGNISEVVFALGLGGNVVGRDISTTFPEAEDLPLVTRAHDVTAESVLSLRPTVVLADTDSGPPEALQHIRNVGVPVVVFDPPTDVDGIGERIEAIAAALGVPTAGRDLADRTRAEVEAVLERHVGEGDRPRVAFLYMRGQAAVYLLGGPGSGADSMIEAAGGRDAGTEMGLDRAFTPLTSEALVAAAPDVILMTTTGLDSVGGIDGLVEIPGIGQTPAGRDRRVATIEDGLLYSFGTRTPQALEDLAEQLHAVAR
ncbi:MAG: hemin ABC transporter substrate-binding protein [Acidimicrobiia bacterium]